MSDEETPMPVPAASPDATIHQRMVAIIDELPAIGKTQRNTEQNFNFRGHDDVMNALTPLLAKHGVFMVPRVLERVATDTRTTAKGKVMYEVNLHVEYTFYGLLGDSFTGSSWGEGTDMGDKSTNKAMTMAFKNVVAQAFAINTQEASQYDADKHTPEETVRGARGGQALPQMATEEDITKLLDDTEAAGFDRATLQQQVDDQRAQWEGVPLGWVASTRTNLEKAIASK